MVDPKQTVELSVKAHRKGVGAGLTTELEAWLDRVIVPALVNEFIAERGKNDLVLKIRTGAQCEPKEKSVQAEAA